MTEQIPYAKLDQGTFLIASPELSSEGIFSRSVVLICEHTPEGSFGLIVNKPLEMDMTQEVMDFKSLSDSRLFIRAGGPVQQNQMMLLHDSPSIPEQTIEVCPGVFLGGDLRFLEESVQNEFGPHLMLCFGFVGWQAGQLEREFLDGHWFLRKAEQSDIFTTPHQKLWQLLLKEMGGKYASYSMIPDDLSLN